MMKKNAYAKKNEPGSYKKNPNICTIIIYLHQLGIYFYYFQRNRNVFILLLTDIPVIMFKPTKFRSPMHIYTFLGLIKNAF